MTVSLGMSVAVAMHGRSMAECVEQAVDEVLLAESLGYDFVLIPEHHSGPPSTVSSVLGLAGHLLAATNRIAVGTGVLLPALYHPRHLLEFHRFATEVFGPRFFLGVGLGYDPADYAAFDTTAERAKTDYASALDRLGAEIGDRDWRSGLAVGAWSRAGLRRCAAVGSTWLSDPIRPLAAVAADAAALRHLSGARSTVILMREAWIGADAESAWVEYEPHLAKVLRYYARNGGGGARVERGPDEPEWSDPLAFVTDAATFRRRLDAVAAELKPAAMCLTLRQPTGPEPEAVRRAITAVAHAAGLHATASAGGES
jgi:hypothetical protein